MRLSTQAGRSDARSIAVIHAALDAGVNLLDTADAYALDDTEVGHNERLIAEALAKWSGDRSKIRVATKGGIRRRGRQWVPDGRARHLREACTASRRALGVDVIDLYQLHVIDRKVSLGTSVRALASLQSEGTVREIGLCNVNVSQIKEAQKIVHVAAVQVCVNPLEDTNIRNGVAEYCMSEGITLIAYRPLCGDRINRLDRDPTLIDLASRHGSSPSTLVLAWLTDLGPIVPIPGATRVETANAIKQVRTVELSDADRNVLDRRFPAGSLLRRSRSERRPADDSPGDVVVVMGLPASGKSTVASDLVERGYQRLNRDEQGGRVADLTRPLSEGLTAGNRNWVLDNTYPSRAARNLVVETAWQHGVPARCIWVDTPLDDARVNAINRMLRKFGRLPMPEDIARAKHDPTCFGPDAQLRYLNDLEEPVLEEGFRSIDRQSGTRTEYDDTSTRALILEHDGVLCSSLSGKQAIVDADDLQIEPNHREEVRRYDLDGWVILILAWRPQVEDGTVSTATISRCETRVRELLGLGVHFAYCPHRAGPPKCWCRKPLPGLVLEFAARAKVTLNRSLLVGKSPADRSMARALRVPYQTRTEFFHTGNS